MVHVENLQPAHPDDTWDQPREGYKTIGHKYRASNREAQPTRYQPIRQSRLIVPETDGDEPTLPSNANNEAELTRRLPTRQSRQAIPEMDGNELSTPRTCPSEPTQHSGEVAPVATGPSHRYNLQPRPARSEEPPRVSKGRK